MLRQQILLIGEVSTFENGCHSHQLGVLWHHRDRMHHETGVYSLKSRSLLPVSRHMPLQPPGRVSMLWMLLFQHTSIFENGCHSHQLGVLWHHRDRMHHETGVYSLISSFITSPMTKSRSLLPVSRHMPLQPPGRVSMLWMLLFISSGFSGIIGTGCTMRQASTPL
jgi:hypothetical protein